MSVDLAARRILTAHRGELEILHNDVGGLTRRLVELEERLKPVPATPEPDHRTITIRSPSGDPEGDYRLFGVSDRWTWTHKGLVHIPAKFQDDLDSVLSQIARSVYDQGRLDERRATPSLEPIIERVARALFLMRNPSCDYDRISWWSKAEWLNEARKAVIQ